MTGVSQAMMYRFSDHMSDSFILVIVVDGDEVVVVIG